MGWVFGGQVNFTNNYGFITDYLAVFICELCKEQYGDAFDKYFYFGKDLNQRDTIAFRKMVGGFIKKVLLPITSAADLGAVPAELVGCFNLIFYQSAENAVFKALGLNKAQWK